MRELRDKVSLALRNTRSWCGTCYVAQYLEEISDTAANISNRLARQGPNWKNASDKVAAVWNAANVLVGTGQGVPLPPLYGGVGAGHDRQNGGTGAGFAYNAEVARESNGRALIPHILAMGRNVARAADQVYFMENLTPAVNSRRANNIRRLQDELERDVRAKIAEIGGTLSIRGSLVGTDLEPYQRRQAELQRMVRDAWIYENTRAELRKRNRDIIRGPLQAATVKAGKEGRDVSDAIDAADAALDAVGEGFDMAKCLAEASPNPIEIIKCGWSHPQGLYFAIGAGILVIILLGWALMPWIMAARLVR
jgi:hypothetical protein